MFRWCGYCQSYRGEREPFDDYSITHGACARCLAEGALDGELLDERIRAIADFFRLAYALAEDGARIEPSELVESGRQLGIAPTDLLVGILQPTLQRVGEAWAAGTFTRTQEADFSSFCSRVLDELETKEQPLDGPLVVMMNAHWNRHTLGLRVATFLLRARGLHVEALWPTPSFTDLAALIESRKPAVLGVSIATAWQCGFLDELVRVVGTCSHRPRIVAGGIAVRLGCTLPEGVETPPSMDVLLLETPLQPATKATEAPPGER